jgi:hypothetical protein
VKKYNDVYFLADPALFVRNHYPLDERWLLLNEPLTLPAFLNGPLIYSTAVEYKVKPVFPDTFNMMTTKGSKISFGFKSDRATVIKNVALYIEQSPTHDSVLLKPQPDESTLYAIDHKFRRKGTYAVHIILDGSHALTYKVTVK